MKLKFGKDYQKLHIEDANVLQVIEGNDVKGSDDPVGMVKEALQNPIGTPRLSEIIKQKNAKSIVIIVNDITRPTPYNYMLPPLIEELDAAQVDPKNVKFIVATGSHRAHTADENRSIFGDYVDKYTFVSHSCDENLSPLGKLSNGIELLINSDVVNADVRIVTGMVDLHYIAGFSGGRKSILPGVAGRELITANHSMMTEPKATTGNFADNPVHLIQMEAAKKVGVDFLLTIVQNTHKEFVRVAAGDIEQAWLEGVKACQSVNMVFVDKQADVAIGSAGGFPKDINIYQSQKGIDNMDYIVKDGGTIILLAECSEGFGEHTFEEWVMASNSMEDIFERFAKGFVLGGHKAYAICKVLKQKEVCLVTSMPEHLVKKMFMRPFATVDEALAYAKEKHGEKFTAYIMPMAGVVLPQVK